jgi:hypothetical protein
MKKVTFDKPTKFGFYRKEVTGYLFTHSNHPGREFIVARGTKPAPHLAEGFEYDKDWYAFERVSGIPIGDSRAPTRTASFGRAIERLSAVTPEYIDERVEANKLKFATAVLRSGSE